MTSRTLLVPLLLLGAVGGADPLDTLLERFSTRYADIRDLRARFVQTSRVASLGTDETSTGRLLYLRPGRLRFEIESPEPHVLVADGEALRMYDPSERVLQIAPLDESAVSQTALGFLFGESDLRASFEVARIRTDGDGEPGGGGRIGLRLTPRGDAAFERIDAWLGARDLQVVELTIFDLLGNQTRLRLEQTEENVGLAESNFTIRVDDDTEVIDLR